jgi:hypothetical protein
MSKNIEAVAEVEVAETAVEVEVETGPKMSKRVHGLEDTCKITVLAEANPKREGSKAWDKFESYIALAAKGEFTVADYIAEGHAKIDLRYDLCASFIAIEGATVEEYEVTPRGEKAEVVVTDEATDEATTETVEVAEAEVAEVSGF